MSKPLRVAWLGLRGFPDVQGGVETHAQNLCPLLGAAGCEVHVISRSSYHQAFAGNEWNGVRFHPVWAPRSKGLEAIVHTFLGVLFAGFVLRPDVLHIHAIGPALMVPLARLFGLRVVVTHHGPDYARQKWGRFARHMLQCGERVGMRWSNERIVISQIIRELVRNKYGQESTLIPNGVVVPGMPSQSSVPLSFGLEPGRYVLLVSRLVAEKRHLDLIAAFKEAALSGWRLAIVGASDHPDNYAQEVLDRSASVPGVVCTGLQTGEALAELYAHAGIFVLPSSHEGLPIVLLEALSYGLPVVASNIAPNLEVGLPAEHYFPLGDVPALAARLNEFAALGLPAHERKLRRAWVSERFDWKDIAVRTRGVYQTAVHSQNSG